MLDKFLPPTDNLYKFMAISGLIFIVLSAAPLYFSFRLSEMKIEDDRNTKLLNVQLQDRIRVQEMRQKAEDDIAKRIKLMSEISKSEAEKVYGEILEGEYPDLPFEVKRIKAIRKILSDYEKNSKEFSELQAKIANSSSDTHVIENYDSYISYLKIATNLTIAIGLILTTFGFYLWYIRVQKPNDTILSKQSINSPTKRKKPRLLCL